jgi:outer membrane protein OmpA-like peptidoglycan-associated protein
MLPLFTERIASSSKWGLWISGGVGLSFFESELFGNNGKSLKSGQNSNKIKSTSLVVPLGLNLEYNISKNIALGLKVNYVSDNRDDMEGGKKGDLNYNGGVTNDFLSVGLVNVRWKFAAKKKPHTHNLNWESYREAVPNKALAMAKKLQDDVDEIEARLNEKPEGATSPDVTPKQLQDTEARLKDEIDNLQAQVDDLKKQLDRYAATPYYPATGGSSSGDSLRTPLSAVDYYGRPIDGNIADNKQLWYNDGNVDSDQDGVPDVRDLDNNTPPNTAVDFYGRAIPLEGLMSIPTIFFDFDKYDLDYEAKRMVGAVAARMRLNPGCMVEVRAFCDYVGDNKYNLKLSRMRAATVRRELVNVYGIAPERIITNGYGRLLEPRQAHRLNRRAEFHFNQ